MVTATNANAAPSASPLSNGFAARYAAADLQATEAVDTQARDCPECAGTGEGPFDTACGGCRGRGYFGSAL